MMPTSNIEPSGNDQHVINIGLHDVKDNEWKLQRKRKVTVYGKINAYDLPIRGARRWYEYVVFNVDNDIEEEALKTNITTNESNVIELNTLSNPEWNRKSYRVIL